MDEAFSFIDIHSHILPDVDDGARDFEESLLIMNKIREAGGKGIVLTPHVATEGNETKLLDKVENQFETLNRLVAENRIALDLYLGAELMLHPELPQKIKGDKRFTINGKGKYALIEMPFFEIPFYAPNVFFNLLASGITPIWAHPERCSDIVKDYRAVLNYTKNGVLLQVNAGSLLGFYGREAKETSIALIKNGLVHVLASDTHRGNVKFPFPEAYTSLEKLVGKTKAMEIVFSTPSKVIN